jgi:hypothetical protein
MIKMISENQKKFDKTMKEAEYFIEMIMGIVPGAKMLILIEEPGGISVASGTCSDIESIGLLQVFQIRMNENERGKYVARVNTAAAIDAATRAVATSADGKAN